ncbi:MAG: hypothetical protein PVF27_00695 [Gemmatimonadales bacterium]
MLPPLQRARARSVSTLASMLARGVLAAGLAPAVACGGGVRPYLTPLPDALVDTVPAPPDAVVRELATAVVGEGLHIRWSSPVEGYLETDWYDVASQMPGGEYATDPHQVVRLRFFADATAEDETRLVSEAVYRRTLDPSLDVRATEVMVPPGHRGDELLRRILGTLRASLGTQR